MSDNFSEKQSKLPSHFAYVVEKGKNDKNYWNKIGAVFEAKDGGYYGKLHALPPNGEFVLRSRVEIEKMRAERQAKSQDHAPSISPQP